MLTHGCALVFKCIGALIMITFGVERPSERGGNPDSRVCNLPCIMKIDFSEYF